MQSRRAKNVSKKVRSRVRAGSFGRDAGSTEYRGPIVPRGPAIAQQSVRRTFPFATPCTSTAGGVINQSINNSPASSPDWSAAGVMYQEYRTLGYTVTFMPNYLNWSSSSGPLAGAPLVGGILRDSGLAVPTSYAVAMQLEGSKTGHIQQRMNITVRMSGVIEAQWANTTAPTISSAVQFYAAGLDSSKAYGWLMVQWLLELRSPN